MTDATTTHLARLLLALVCASALVMVSPEPGVAATKAPKVSNARPVAGETIVFRGRLATKFKRTVAVQRKKSGSWKTVEKARTTKRGKYRMRVRIKKSGTYRVRAPRTTHDRSRVKAVNSRSRKVRTIGQSGSTTASAPAAQTVSTGASSYASSLLRVPVQAMFTPARPGRVVRLQKLSGGTYRTVAKGRQDAGGAVVFRVGTGNVGSTFRAVAKASGGASQVVARAVTVPRWREKFADDFRGSSLSNRWGTRNPNNQTLVSSRTASAARPENVTVGGGVASLRVKPMTCGVGRTKPVAKARGKGCFSNAQIGTDVAENPFTFRYGVMAARIKFARGGGMHGAFWSPDPQFNGPRGSEIDVAEYFGDGRARGGLAQFIHADGRKFGGETNRNWLLPKDRSWSSDYHVYSVEWTPTQYVFRVDGRETYRTRGEVSRESQTLILSMLSSDWEIPAIKRGKVANDPMKVDWVRVWQR